jgi:alpha-tubulin suppressor-like RCC1 family protein
MCAIVSNGSVNCWGRNDSGELGNGALTDSSVPVSVTGLDGPVTGLSGGMDYTCALLATGEVECWGANVSGLLGVSGPTQVTSPTVVNGLASAGLAVTSGDLDSCALLSDRSVRCWGFNLDGQLGNGTTTDSSQLVTVKGLTGVTALAAGNEFVCALLSGSVVKCWGENNAGQLGNGTMVNSSTPVTVLW